MYITILIIILILMMMMIIVIKIKRIVFKCCSTINQLYFRGEIRWSFMF